MLVKLLKIPDYKINIIHKGQKVFLYDFVNDKFILKVQYDLLTKEDRQNRIFAFPALNRNNAIRKIKKYFVTELKP
jgi:hypothetical protein